MPNSYSIKETASYQKSYQKKSYEGLYQKVKSVIYPVLKNEPRYGKRIRRLHGNLGIIYRYRVDEMSLFYFFDEDRKTIYLLEILKNTNGLY